MTAAAETITQSTVKDFHRCKRRWWLRYVRRLGKPAEWETPTGVGNMVHDALAEWYAGGLDDPTAHVAALAEAACLASPQHEQQILKDAELALIMVEGYVGWLEETAADAGIESVTPEREVELELAPARDGFGPVVLRAKLDGEAALRDGWQAILEHKTVGNFIDLPAIARMDPQLLTYELALYLEGRANGEEQPRVSGALLNMLRKVKRSARAKPPFYERHEERHNVQQLRSHWEHLVGAAREMQALRARLEAGENHHAIAPPNVVQQCRWDCEFFQVCPLIDDGSDWEYVLATEYEERDPLARYQQLEKK